MQVGNPFSISFLLCSILFLLPIPSLLILQKQHYLLHFQPLHLALNRPLMKCLPWPAIATSLALSLIFPSPPQVFLLLNSPWKLASHKWIFNCAHLLMMCKAPKSHYTQSLCFKFQSQISWVNQVPFHKKNPWKVIKETFYDQSLMKKPWPISSLSPTYWTNLTNLLSQYCPLI
jgi:hypothetical protein